MSKLEGVCFIIIGVSLFTSGIFMSQIYEISEEGDCFDRHGSKILGEICVVKTYDPPYLENIIPMFFVASVVLVMMGLLNLTIDS